MVISRRRFADNGKEVYKNKEKEKGREGRAKLLFLYIKLLFFVHENTTRQRERLVVNVEQSTLTVLFDIKGRIVSLLLLLSCCIFSKCLPNRLPGRRVYGWMKECRIKRSEKSSRSMLCISLKEDISKRRR